MSDVPFESHPTQPTALISTGCISDASSTKTTSYSGSLPNFPTAMTKTETAPSNDQYFGIPTTTLKHLAGFSYENVTPIVAFKNENPKSGDSNVENVNLKKIQLPNEIVQTVKELRAIIRTRQTYDDTANEPNTKCNIPNDIKNLQCLLEEMFSSLVKNCNQMKTLRSDTSEATLSAILAQCRKENLTESSQFNIPIDRFQNIVTEYEQNVMTFRKKMELTEKNIHFLTETRNVSLQDLESVYSEINKNLKASTKQLQLMYKNLDALRDHYLFLQRYL